MTRNAPVVLKKPSKAIIGVVALWLLSLVWISYLMGPTHKVIAVWESPAMVKYDVPTRYYLSVVEWDREWSVLENRRNHRIYVGLEKEDPSYGHWIKFSFDSTPTIPDVNSCIKKSVVEWTDAGVTLTDVDGHKFFIPEKLFTHGR